MSPLDNGSDIHRLAELVAIRNEWERETSEITGRPALIGHLGEYIGARIFDIQLHDDAARMGSDGVFVDSPLAGQTVNIKWYARQEGILDLAPGYPDYYLVLAGPRAGGKKPNDYSRSWLIEFAYLFSSTRLIEQLMHVKLGIATSVQQPLWADAEIYPTQRCPDLILTDYQRGLLRLFGAKS